MFLQRAVARVGRQLGLGNPAGIAQGVLRCGLAGDQYLVPVALLPHHKDAVPEEGLRVVEIVRGERFLLGRRHGRQPAAYVDRICQGGMVDWTRALRRGPHRGHRNGDISAARSDGPERSAGSAVTDPAASPVDRTPVDKTPASTVRVAATVTSVDGIGAVLLCPAGALGKGSPGRPTIQPNGPGLCGAAPSQVPMRLATVGRLASSIIRWPIPGARAFGLQTLRGPIEYGLRSTGGKVDVTYQVRRRRVAHDLVKIGVHPKSVLGPPFGTVTESRAER